jgi:hypothetical protein
MSTTNDRISSTQRSAKALEKSPASDPRVGATSTHRLKDPYDRSKKKKP